MNFELLPNETILDLFEYIPIVHLFHAFFNLNSRFNQLLCLQCRKFHLDLRFLSKTKFHQICENYVPLVIDRIISVNLSNDENTPQQIELFLSQSFQLRQFIYLQSITISDLRSCETLDQIMNECSYLSCLTHLTFSHGFIRMNESDANSFLNQIWSLKNLNYCHLTFSFSFENYFRNLTAISTSIKHLILQRTICSLSRLFHLCHHTPNLQYLSTIYNDRPRQLEFIPPIQSIIRLKIHFFKSIDIVKQLLRNLPNLHHLTCEPFGFYIDGYQWEEIIRQYLPKLQILQFSTRFSPLSDKDKEIQLNEIIDTYRTKFWIEEHRWFVQCYCSSFDDQNQSGAIHLFTLPYPFRCFTENRNCIVAKSTSPSDDVYLTFNSVNDLVYINLDFMRSITSRFRFCNITDLALSLPFDDQFLSVVSRLDRLTTLHVLTEKDTNVDKIQSQLQLLLDQAVHLHSLRIDNRFLCSSSMPSMQITSASVRYLNLQNDCPDEDWLCHDEEECVQLIRSSLGKQCETLLIRVKNRKNIVDLVNNMPNLQALIARCDDDTRSDEDDSVSSIDDDELIHWLRQELPTTCSITRDKYFIEDIEVWIR